MRHETTRPLRSRIPPTRLYALYQTLKYGPDLHRLQRSVAYEIPATPARHSNSDLKPQSNRELRAATNQKIHIAIKASALGNVLSDIVSHHLIRIEKGKLYQLHQYILAWRLPQPPMEDTIPIVLRGALHPWLVCSHEFLNQACWQQVVLPPLGREFHYFQIGISVHKPPPTMPPTNSVRSGRSGFPLIGHQR